MLDMDDVMQVRVVAKCWNDGRRHGKMGFIFLQKLHSDSFVKHWYYDVEGNKLCSLRNPIMASFRQWDCERPRCSFRLTTPALSKVDMSWSAEERIYDLFINQGYVEYRSIDTMSNSSESLDLDDMWHHG